MMYMKFFSPNDRRVVPKNNYFFVLSECFCGVYSYAKKNSLLFSITFFLVLVAVSFSIKIKTSKALLGFGGQIQQVITCSCSDNIAIVVGTPTVGVFLYEPSTTLLDREYQLFSEGPWVLGAYTEGGVCEADVDGVCEPVANPTGTIVEVGTSL